jgi:small subunit ribosomal protein S8
MKVAISKVLQNEGYIAGYHIDENGGKPNLNIELKYFQGKPVIEEIKRASRPGLRSYKNKEELPKVRAGLGISIMSTNKGLMTATQAQAAGIGGEVLCTVF